ncbi:MAG: hypothetical protein ACR2FY_09865 [Pirellulaceae bacterium]
MKQPVKESRTTDVQSIEDLQKRYQQLDRQKTVADTNLTNATKRLDELKKEGREKYGTDDVEELRRKLDSMKSENDAKRRQYQADLDRIEKELAAVEQKFAASENEPETPGEQS